jgi:hypothetical protein
MPCRAAKVAGVRIVVRKVETAATLALLEQGSSASATTVHAQGDFLARTQASLPAQRGQAAFSAGFGRSSGYGLIAPPMSYTP